MTGERDRREALRQLEDEILLETRNAFERVVFVAADGTPLYHIDGDLGHVYLSEEDVAQWFGRVDLVTHNHPRETSFTDSDVLSAIALDARELNAFGPRVRYRLFRRPGGGGWPARDVAEAAIRRLDERIHRQLLARLITGALMPLQAEALHRRRRWVAFARVFAADVDYREEWR